MLASECTADLIGREGDIRRLHVEYEQRMPVRAHRPCPRASGHLSLVVRLLRPEEVERDVQANLEGMIEADRGAGQVQLYAAKPG